LFEDFFTIDCFTVLRILFDVLFERN
jgi:hypothetical protein